MPTPSIAWSVSKHGQFPDTNAGNIPCIVEQLLLQPHGPGAQIHPAFDSMIRTAIPDKGYDGPVVLDIERTPRGPIWLEVLSRATALRPHAQIGFYGLPRNQYWPLIAPRSRPSEWHEDVHGLRWLTDLTAAVFGNAYAFYPLGQTRDHTIEGWRLVVEMSAIATLAVARGRPAYLMMMPWYHPGNPAVPWPTPVLAEQLRAAIDVALSCGVTPLFWATTSPLGDKPDTVTPAALARARKAIEAMAMPADQ